MLVTRTERYTDWYFQAAHANEQAATVGVGLLRGHIYYRHSYDMLKSGDEVVREKSFVTLSDGTTYELGNGLSSDKVSIQFVGLTSGEEVYITVEGRPELGVGVSSVYRDVTIQYDDGKVPVLDTDQLDSILAELSDNLTGSMVDTAEKVKEELSEKVETAKLETTALADVAAGAARDAAIREANRMMQQVSTTLNEEMDRKDRGVVSEITEKINSKSYFAAWAIGQYTVADGQSKNLTDGVPSRMEGSDKFIHNSSAKVVKFSGTHPRMNMLFRVTANISLQIDDPNTQGHLCLQLADQNGNVVHHQSMLYLSRQNRLPQNIGNLQMSVMMFIAHDYLGHPLFNGGLRIQVANLSSGEIRVLSNSAIYFSLESM